MRIEAIEPPLRDKPKKVKKTTYPFPVKLKTKGGDEDDDGKGLD